MTHKINRTVWTVLVLALLAAMLSLPAPYALADGEVSGAGKDTVTVAEDGTATLFSSGMAGSEVCSLQLSFNVPADTVFTFADALAGRMTSQKTTENGLLTIYIAGAEPLMQIGQTTLVLGTFSPAEGVRPVEDSLSFVYGGRVISQTLEVEPLALTEREQLQALVDEAKAMDSLGEPQKRALANAEELLKKADATDAELNAAYNELYGQLYEQSSGRAPGSGGTVSEERAALEAELENALALDAGVYDKDTVGVLNEAIDKANAALNSASDADIKAAREALAAAISGLKKVGQPRLEAALSAAKAKLNDGNSYSAQSREALEDAILAAEAVLANGSATDEERTAAAQTLEAATENMVPQGADSSGPVYDGSGGGAGLDGSTGDVTQTPAQTAPATATPAPTAAATAGAAAPNTGDETVLLPWLAVLCLAGAALTVLLRRGRTRI